MFCEYITGYQNRPVADINMNTFLYSITTTTALVLKLGTWTTNLHKPFKELMGIPTIGISNLLHILRERRNGYDQAGGQTIWR